MNRSSCLAALFVALAGLGLAGCASRRPAPVFSTHSPADPKAPSAPVTPVEPLGAPGGNSRESVKPASGETAAPGQDAPATYVCPMHPQAKSDRPGACPICGMSLVKAKPKVSQP